VKAYRFRLSTVARIRALEERVATDLLRVSLREVRRAHELERAAHGALADLAVPTGSTTMSAHAWTRDQADRLSASHRASREAVGVAELAADEARQAWKVATKRSEVLLRLEAHGFARWRDDMMRQEAIELDDLSHARLARLGAER
jgi:flagellar biosynthesis chaperone FliJ